MVLLFVNWFLLSQYFFNKLGVDIFLFFFFFLKTYSIVLIRIASQTVLLSTHNVYFVKKYKNKIYPDTALNPFKCQSQLQQMTFFFFLCPRHSKNIKKGI